MFKKLILLLCCLFWGGIGFAWAEPRIDAAQPLGENFNHGDSARITGAYFGTKSPAAPLMWDSAENRTRNSPGALSSHGWDYVNQLSYSAPTRPQYNTDGYRNVDSAHAHSSQHITMGHDYSTNPSNPANTMDVGMDAGSQSNRWFIMWYSRLDPLWPSYQSGCNLKILWLSSAGFDISSGHQYIFQADGKLVGASQIGYDRLSGNSNSNCDLSWHQDSPFNDRGNNPENGWVHMEYNYGNDLGLEKLLTDNIPVFGYEEADCVNGMSAKRYVTIGSYYRKNSSLATDDNAFRHYDDCYIDNTLARVMLANDPDYDDATIVEPQIPYAWNSNGQSIEVALNLGKFNEGETGYLFVFDADNSHNPTGYPITIGGAGSGGGGDNPPIINISSPTTSITYGTSESSMDIGGSASDDNSISTITWSNSRGGSGTANNDSGDYGTWSVGGISLQDGANIITVTVTDSANQTSSDSITVTYSSSDIIQTWDANLQTGDDSWGKSYVTYCARLLIEGSHVSNSGSAVRLGFHGRSLGDGDYTIRKVSIAEKDTNGGNGDVVDSTWTKVTFDGNSVSNWANGMVTIPAGEEKISDSISFQLEAGKDYYVTFSIESASVWLAPASDYRELYFETGDHTEDIDWSELGFDSAWDYHALSSIYIVSSTGEAPGIPEIIDISF